MAREAEASGSSEPAPSELQQQQAGAGGDTPRGRRRRARGDPLLIVCRCFSVVTAAIAALCVAINVLSAVQSFRRYGDDIFGGIFRYYAVVLALFVGVVETEWGFILKFRSKVLRCCVDVGILIGFSVAVMAKTYPNVERSDLILLQDIESREFWELEKWREELEALLIAERSEVV